MRKNKKSAVLGSLLMIVLALLFFFFAVKPMWENVSTYIFDTNRKYIVSFEEFVEEVNNMRTGIEQFEIQLKDKSAIIGFSKGASRFECFNCYIGDQGRPRIIVDKPHNIECQDSACACLCTGEFKLEEKGLDEFGGKQTRNGSCQNPICKSLDDDIVDKTVVKRFEGLNLWLFTVGEGVTEHWNDGFLFTRNIAGANGLKLYNEELTTLIVEKERISSPTSPGEITGVIGVCNLDMFDYNKNNLGFEGCLAERLERTLSNKGYTKDFRDAAKKFSSAIEQAVNSNLDNCRVEFDKYPGFGDEAVKLFDNNGKLQVKAEKKGDVLMQEIDNYFPCMVDGRNFWKFMNDGSEEDNHEFEIKDITIFEDDKMSVDPDPFTKKREEKPLFNDRPMIYKYKDTKNDVGYICLIPAFEDSNGDCGIDNKVNNGEFRNYVDTDCLRGNKLHEAGIFVC